MSKHPAMLYEKLEGNIVQCHLCAHQCQIRQGKRGICLVRENTAGELYSLVYGQPISTHVDPIEKKPLYHFYPGTKAYSMATVGCNFRCAWCQNWQISQAVRDDLDLHGGRDMPPKALMREAQRSGCRSIAYTYTEPTIFFEYAYDTARLAHQAGIANVFVTNGYMSQPALESIHPYLDAANVDLKAFRDETYRQFASARLQPVLDTLKAMKALGIWVEVTTLVVTDTNDQPDELGDIAAFIADELGPETPWHVSRYRPTYKHHTPPTPVSTLVQAWEIGKQAGLHYVFVGNVPGSALPKGVQGESSYCHQCGALLIARWGFSIRKNQVRDGACPQCGAKVAGVGLKF